MKLKCKDQAKCLWTGQLWEGPVPGLDWRKNQCHHKCPDCGGPARITRTKLIPSQGRVLTLECKDQSECFWVGQLWEERKERKQ